MVSTGQPVAANRATAPDAVALFAAVVRLRALQPGAIAATHGQHAHAAFLALVDSVDPELAQRLHDADSIKPFTVSPIGGFTSPGRENTIAVRPDDQLWLRFTLLQPQIFAAVTSRFLTAAVRPEITIGAVRFQVTGLFSTLASEPWAGYTSFAALLDGERTAARAPQRTVMLEFASPTAFSFGKRAVVLPQPELVFGGLLRKWNAFAPAPMPAELLALIREQVVVSEVHNLNTQMLDFGRYKEKGFTGTVAFTALGTWTEEQLRQWNALADFAFYAGVGYKTTMGMGLVRRVAARPER